MLSTKKKGAPILPKSEAPTINPPEADAIHTPIIDEPSPKNKGKIKGKNKSGLTMASTVPTLAVKVYEEQVEGGFEALKDRVLIVETKEYWIWGIVHDKDLNADEIFEPAIKKPHVHVWVVRKATKKGNIIDRRKVSTILNMLGITFRPGLDDELWRNRGVEPIADISGCVAYATHETKQCELAGKEVYDRDEIFSNLSKDELDQIREGYTRISAVAQKADLKTQAELAELAYKIGYTGEQDWNEFDAALPTMLQRGSAYLWLRRKYAEGMAKRFEENRSLVRLSIFIQGPQNVGKTTGARKAIEAMGLSCYEVSDGGKTGRWDRLKPSHDALLVDDTVLNDVLGMADNRVVEVYRRNGENPYFCGKLLVVCSNMSFDDWLKACNVQDRQKEAARSRFYLCRTIEENGVPRLVIDEHSTRGTTIEQAARMDMFLQFAKPMEASMQEYKGIKKETVDYSPLDAYRETEPRQISLWDKPKAPSYKRPVWRDPVDKTLRYSWGDGMTHNKSYEEGYLKDDVFHSERLVKYIKDEDEDEPLSF